MVRDEDLSNLSPEEKIKKLKELEKKKKQEIQEVEELIEQSHKDLSDKAQFEQKVPIPHVASRDISALSVEGRELVTTHRGLSRKVEEEIDEKKEEKDDDESLEETVGAERVAGVVQGAHPQYALQQGVHPAIFDSQYIGHLSQQPAQDLYREMSVIYELVSEKGYASAQEVRRAEQLAAAVNQKVQDSEQGRYSFSADVARAASLSQAVGAKVRNAYQSGKNFGGNWYER